MHKICVFGHEWGRNSRFWGFEKGNRRGIARSSDLDYSRGSKRRFLIILLNFIDFPGFWAENTVFSRIIGPVWGLQLGSFVHLSIREGW